MCGIAGIRRLDGARVDEALLVEMVSQLTHRGPDDVGIWVDGATGFGHRRLSIIDLAGSRQPMVSVDGRTAVTFNGEIFNYRELRRGCTYPFRTNGDTEVLLAMHEQHGAHAPERLRGQFAYALFDRAAHTLLLVRDRLGVLPLYYYVDQRFVAFASEIKALLPALPGGPVVDAASLDDYLAHRSVPSPGTLFEGVRKVRPGHIISINDEGRVAERCYWSLPAPDAVTPMSASNAVERVNEALRGAVDAALVADVPVGAYLSGGVDSSLIVALANRARTNGDTGKLQTFAAGFGDARYDELPFARTVSEHVGTEHHEVSVTPEDFESLWSTLTWHRDAPLSEPADVAVYKLATAAKERVKVVLSGEGSDELFGGYPKYRYWPLMTAAAMVPPSVRRQFGGWFERALPLGADRARTAVRALSASRDERLRAWFSPFTERERALLLAERNTSHSSPRPHGDLVRQMLVTDCGAWLADNLLERGDRMTMAASLELRPPFLDREVVELAFSLPSNIKVRRGVTKWVVKEVAKRVLPPAIVERPKVGFRVPLDAWFRGRLESVSRDLLTSPSSFVAEIFDSATVNRLLSDHASGRRNEEIRIWTLVCLEVWHQTFFKARHTTPRVQEGPPSFTLCDGDGS